MRRIREALLVCMVGATCSSCGDLTKADAAGDSDPRSCRDGAGDIGPMVVWYLDGDGDGYGAMDGAVLDCDPGMGYVDNAGDCDDTDAAANPGLPEVAYDGVDNDCDAGTADDDLDADGYVLAADCDDTNASTWPGAEEVCGDATVNDCDGTAREAFDSCGLAGSVSLAEADVSFTAEAEEDEAGYPVAGAGDVDADGRADLLIGATRSEIGAPAGGAAYLVLDPSPGEQSLSDAAARFLGATNEVAGEDLSSGGDLNGDLYGDVIIGAEEGDRGGINSGTVYFVMGPVWGDLELLPEADAWLFGEEEQDYAGTGLATLGDVDEDGWADTLVGAANSDAVEPESGVVYVIYGPVSGEVDLSTSLRLTGAEAGSRIGISVAQAGDTDGDGVMDQVLGADDYFATTRPGVAYLVLGPVTTDLDVADADAVFQGEEAGSGAGFSVSGAGDMNSDGFADVVVGAYNQDGGTGVAFVITGPSSGESSLGDAAGVYLGEVVGDCAGFSVAGTGDVDGDDADDIIVGAYLNDAAAPAAGSAYLVLGPPAGTEALTAAAARLEGEANSDTAGVSVAGPGDTNGDGFADLLVGAPLSDRSGDRSGAAFLMYGGGY